MASGEIPRPRRFSDRYIATASALVLLVLSSSSVWAQSIISTVAGAGFLPSGTQSLSVPLGAPQGVWMDSAGNLYVAATGLDLVYKIDASGQTTVVAGTGFPGFGGDGGPATAALLDAPTNVVTDAAGNMFISEPGNRVRRVDAATGIITTYAGGGKWSNPPVDGIPALGAYLQGPRGLAIDAAGNLFISDSSRIRRVDAATGIITTYAGGGSVNPGDGGPATDAVISGVDGIALDAAGNLFITDTGHDTVRRVDATTHLISRVAGGGPCCVLGDGGPATSASIGDPAGIAVDAAGNLYVSESRNGYRVRKVDAATGLISSVVTDGIPKGLSVDGAGNIYVADQEKHRIRKLDTGGVVTNVAGNGTWALYGDGGPAVDAMFAHVTGMTMDPSGNLFILDTQDARVRKVDAATGIITTYAGGGTLNAEGVPATSARLNYFINSEPPY